MTHRTLLLPLAVIAGMPLPAQVPTSPPKLELVIPVELHSPRPTCVQRVTAMCASRETRELVQKTLGEGMAPTALELNAFSDGDDRIMSSALTFHIALSAVTKEAVPEARSDELAAAIVRDLQRRLQTALVDEPRTREASRLQELEDQASKLETEYLDLRKRAAAMLRADLQVSGAIAADLEKQQLNVELDLRTEEAVRRQLEKQLAETQQRRDELRSRLMALGKTKGDLQAAWGSMQRRPEGEREEALQKAKDLQRQIDETETTIQTLGADARQLEAQLEAVTDEMRKATSTVNRLTPRLRLLQDMAKAQQQKIAEAEAAAAERDAALARADDVKARMQALRQRAEEIRGRLDAMEPVRLEIWK